MASRRLLSLEEIQRAAEVVATVAHETPVHTSRSLNDLVGGHLLLKAENLQRTGSFKIRGAAYKIATLSQAQRLRGVIAASAGNHAQGVALAARQAGIPRVIVMPERASLTKVQATRGYGAEVILHGATYEEAAAHARRLAVERGLTFIHAFDDPAVVAGQGTVGLELCRQAEALDLVVVTVGGGGLLAGIATAVKALCPRARVIGVQVDAAPACVRSFQAKRLVSVRPAPTIADGIAIAQPGQFPLQMIRRSVDDMVTVTDEEIAWAIVVLLERAKLLVEGAGAAAMAALLCGHIAASGKTTAVVLSGGNIDPLLLSRVLDHGLAREGRFLTLGVYLPDLPGQLAHLLEAVAQTGANVVEVAHQRRGLDTPPGRAKVEITVETRDLQHADLLARHLQERGYEISQPPANVQAPTVTEAIYRPSGAPGETRTPDARF